MIRERVCGSDPGLRLCAVCELLVRIPQIALRHSGRIDHACPRCGSRLHRRKENSVQRAWALLVAAVILYIPANLLPVTVSRSLLGEQRDTIISGVIFLWQTGSWPLALLVFFASITVPLLKLLSLALLLISVRRHSQWHPHERGRLYRLLEFIGRWSMLDIYVVTVLAALVQIRSLATIQVGPGAVAFGAVVILTMLATRAFDPRLIWDPWNLRRDRPSPARPHG